MPSLQTYQIEFLKRLAEKPIRWHETDEPPVEFEPLRKLGLVTENYEGGWSTQNGAKLTNQGYEALGIKRTFWQRLFDF
jgi:hypothetical protein